MSSASPTPWAGGGIGAPGLTGSVFQTVFECSPEAIALTRVRDGVLVEVNTEWLSLTGYSRAEALGRTAVEMGHWLDPEERMRVFAPLLTGGRVVDTDVTLVMQDRNPRVVRMNAALMQEQEEQYILIYLRDVTAERLAHEALRAGEQALEHANEKLNRQVKLYEVTESVAKVGHWVIYPGDSMVHLSRGYGEIVQEPGRALVPKERLLANVMEEDRERVLQARARMDGQTVEYRLRRSDGSVVWLRSRMHRQVEGGQVRADFGIVQEFTSERQARQELENQLAFIQKITSRAPGMVYEYQMWPDKRSAFPFVSAAVQQLFGLTPEEARNDPASVLRAVHPDDATMVVKSTWEAAKTVQPWHCEFRTRPADGQERWMLGYALPEVQADGSVLFCGSITDITSQKEALTRLKLSEERFRNLSALSSDWYWEQDAEFRFVRVDGDGRIDSYLAPEEAMGRTRWDSGALGVTAAQWAAHKAQLLAHETFYDFELQRVRADGTYMWASISGEPMFDVDGVFTGYRGTGRDISARKQAEADIERLAFYDALTGLPNRRLLIDRLNHAVAASARNSHHGALLFIDLDNFKILNDTLGHHMGDLLLQQVAQRLQECVRTVDTVARLGGDEFVVMLEELGMDPAEAAAQAETVAKKILQTLNQQFALASHNLHSSPSIGVTLFYQHLHSVDELLKRADLAMYQAKGAGRNTLRFFDPEMQAAATARAAMETDLRQGMLRDEFMLYYQCVVDAEGVPTGVEALLRWKHPQRGIVSPGEFIPIAEQTGLILPLGQWVLEAACAQLVAWSAKPHTQKLTMAVNVSARQFKHPEFSNHILNLLRLTGANPYRLKLELTESLLLSEFDEVIEKMSELRSIGVGFSLDDFGTGYSSLSYLKRLPLDQLKIDQSFVRDVLTDPNDAAIARTILNLAESLDLGVVAEGVETAGQHDFLLRNGCKAFQGYFFGRPVPVELLQLPNP
ncbi:diguanylate cyclase (GGDEF)-like protein/PAS domain S-box-containing protein [Rhodoferax saidenbachensis]|uniref:Diguanylate cyclase (GGDEF)-like protein/PAS domain S-box-containing protein n=1 Tax=Rhodoferax saidenbachensis TaxID=1484693 RepID=A0ABU1ZQM3_9BURK|nr:diguanylate cyclase (GGDEF)-like protein/PAS domain S-box-containing protein [Rhodoferax saidenbachensis]